MNAIGLGMPNPIKGRKNVTVHRDVAEVLVSNNTT